MKTVFVLYVLLLDAGSRSAAKGIVTKLDVKVISELCHRLECRQFVFLGCKVHLDVIKKLSEVNVFSVAVPHGLRIGNFGSADLAIVGTLLVEKIQVRNGSNEPFHSTIHLMSKIPPSLDYRLVFDESAPNKSFSSLGKFSFRYNLTHFRIWEIIDRKQFRGYSTSQARRRTDLGGTTLKVIKDTDKDCEKLQHLHVFQRARCFHDYMSHLMSIRLNFTEQETTCPEKIHRYVFPNGSYSGLFKMLLDGEADYSTGSFVVSGNRLPTFDFVWPTFTLKAMMYVKEEESKGHWNSYIKPFRPGIWWMLITTVATSGFFFFLLDCLNRFKHLEKADIGNAETADYFLSALGIFCGQALVAATRTSSDPTRIYHSTILFVAMILYYAYSGSLLSSLTVHKPGLPFTDLDGFFADGSFKMSAANDSFMLYYFQHEYVSPRKLQVSSFLVGPKKIPKSDKEGIDGICEESLIYLGIKENVYSLEGYKCKVLEIPSPVLVQYLAIVVPEYSPIREYFARELAYYRSSGILKRMEFQLRSTSLFRSKLFVKKEQVYPVVLSEIISAIAFLAGGMAVSFCVFLVEKAVPTISFAIKKTFFLLRAKTESS